MILLAYALLLAGLWALFALFFWCLVRAYDLSKPLFSKWTAKKPISDKFSGKIRNEQTKS